MAGRPVAGRARAAGAAPAMGRVALLCEGAGRGAGVPRGAAGLVPGWVFRGAAGKPVGGPLSTDGDSGRGRRNTLGRGGGAASDGSLARGGAGARGAGGRLGAGGGGSQRFMRQRRAVASMKASMSLFIFFSDGGCRYIMWPAS